MAIVYAATLEDTIQGHIVVRYTRVHINIPTAAQCDVCNHIQGTLEMPGYLKNVEASSSYIY